MALVIDKFFKLLPGKTKTSPSGWLSFNAPCCHHRGHSQDKRKRAGVKIDGEGFVYNCFNCKFSTGWQPGGPFGDKLRNLCKWLGAGDSEIKEMIFESLKSESSTSINQESYKLIEFIEKSLPENSKPIYQWIKETNSLEIEQQLSDVVSYVVDRGFDPLNENFWWSNSAGYEQRVLIPFLYQGKVVGNTARKITDGKPKYLSDQHPNFVFNLDAQTHDQKYIFVVEGPFDALAVNGVALLTNNISDQQARLINNIAQTVIVIPDQDKSGLAVYDKAKELGWAIAQPNWEIGIKDCAEAVKKYGKLFVVTDIISGAVSGEIKINMAKRTHEKNINKRIKDV